MLTEVLGCVRAPVQEMSDARQAIQAARDAGARPHISPELKEAEGLLKQAQELLELGNYDEARDSALHAKRKALEARTAVLTSEEQGD
jgi:hypothetical protein